MEDRLIQACDLKTFSSKYKYCSRRDFQCRDNLWLVVQYPYTFSSLFLVVPNSICVALSREAPWPHLSDWFYGNHQNNRDFQWWSSSLASVFTSFEKAQHLAEEEEANLILKLLADI